MTKIAEAGSLFQLINSWAKGHIDEQQVHMDAEVMFEALQSTMQKPVMENRISLVYEVLSQLSILNYQLITSEDIPAIIQFLNTPQGEEQEGWRKWHSYWDTLDITQRRDSLEGNSYYSTTPFSSD